MCVSPYVIGLDIGTTTISAIVVHTATGDTPVVRNIPNDTTLPSPHPAAHLQNPAAILTKIHTLLDELLTVCPAVCAIGITGQMHGILYFDDDGCAVSPLYTWQDGHATPEICADITEKTGYPISPGYGLATHVALSHEEAVPETAVGLCTIMDYVAMGLTGAKRPLLHATNAASLGLYDLSQGGFDTAALEKLPLSPAFLPKVVTDCRVLGEYTTSSRPIPVTVAIGDNQAAFLGSVREPEKTILVNIGTGSQVSLCLLDTVGILTGAVETRPYLGDSVLVSGSGLCGGRAYAILERFFRRYAVMLGLPDSAQYELLNRLAAEGMSTGYVLDVRTTFCGTREDPTLRGQIAGIDEDNFTPEGLAAGVLTGMAMELYNMVEKIIPSDRTVLVASGNGVRKNPVLRQILQAVFGLPLCMPAHQEEAAFGAAMSAGRAMDMDLSHCITYQLENEGNSDLS